MNALPTLPALPRPASLLPAASDEAAPRRASDAGEHFSDRLWRAVQDIDAQQRDAARRLEAVDTGRSDDLIGAMLGSQQASLSFSLLVQVRNKVMIAFDDIMKMSA